MRRKKLPSLCRFDFMFLPDSTVRTFNKDIFEVKSSLIVKHTQTKQALRIEDIFYDIRTVKDKHGTIVAKRKNPNQELILVKK